MKLIQDSGYEGLDSREALSVWSYRHLHFRGNKRAAKNEPFSFREQKETEAMQKGERKVKAVSAYDCASVYVRLSMWGVCECVCVCACDCVCVGMITSAWASPMIG